MLLQLAMAVLVYNEASADDDNDDDVEMTNERHTSASVLASLFVRDQEAGFHVILQSLVQG
jgi:hypothetical protein